MELYNHQIEGVDWLASKDRAMLLDEQGLGKTVTAIVAASQVALREGKSFQTLVLCPSVVLWNWAREWETWGTKGASIQVISSGKESIDPLVDVVITTHTLLLSPDIRRQIMLTMWGITILDEAHMFRTPKAQRTVAFYGRYTKATSSVVSSSDRVWCLTGTPMPNNASEIWTHLWGLDPYCISDHNGVAMSYHRFLRNFCVCKETPWGLKVVGNRNVTDLRRRMDGLILRRKKSQVLDLPDIRFDSIVLRPKELSSKLRELSDVITESMDAAQGLSAIKATEEFSRWRRMSGIAKIDPVSDLLKMESESGSLDKCVVFAHHKDVISGIVTELRSINKGEENCVIITGSTSPKDRDRMVYQFQNDPKIKFAVCNIVAGGVGTTLTAASEVVFVELSPVPGENAQAADRCHRIGQDKKVRVRFIALSGTVDEDIVRILKNKTKMIKQILDETPEPKT